MNKILRRIFPHIPERNQIHHFNPWHEKMPSPSYSSFTRFPPALPLFQHPSRIDSSNNGHTARFFHDSLPDDIGLVSDVQTGGGRGIGRHGFIIPNSDPGDEDNAEGFIDVLQVASNERGLERLEQHPQSKLPQGVMSEDTNKFSGDDEENQFSKNEEEIGDQPRSMTSSGHRGLHGRKPEPAALGKRGPECMRRCIAQGVLHPVQCHSLCWNPLYSLYTVVNYSVIRDPFLVSLHASCIFLLWYLVFLPWFSSHVVHALSSPTQMSGELRISTFPIFFFHFLRFLHFDILNILSSPKNMNIIRSHILSRPTILLSLFLL